MKNVSELFKNSIIIPILIASSALIIAFSYYMPKVALENTISTTTKNSNDLVTQMRIFRSYYSEKILAKVKSQTDLKVNYDHEIKSDTIPLPATSIHDLGKLFTDGTDTEVRMYSDYPFPNRKDRKLDSFEEESLKFFEKNPNTPYIKKETLNGEKVVRYAVADFLTNQGCVNCHNQRADSPKVDWRLGDVRGAIEIITPINDELSAKNDIQKNILIFIAINVIFLVSYFSFISINRKKMLEQLNENFNKNIKKQTQRFNHTTSVFENATEAITICDTNSIIIDINKTFSKITGYTKDEVIGKHISILKSGKQDATFYKQMWESIAQRGYWEGEITNKRKNGELYDEMLHISAATNSAGYITHYIAVFTDVNDKRETQESIYNLAHFDSLTKIANRNFFQKKLAVTIKELKPGLNIPLIYLDLDRFKIVNDSLGHKVGDELLRSVAKRIQKLLNHDDFFARLGGDEFAIFTESTIESKLCEEKAIEKANKIIEALNSVFIIDNNQLSIGSSIGIALYPRDAKNIDELMQYADTAMYHAKDSGRNCYTVYSGDIASEIRYRYKIEQELRVAIKENQITVVYQPIIASKYGTIKGFEVLSRWIHKDLGFVSPELFIGIAEERGLIAEYTLAMLENACNQINFWNKKYSQNLYVSVNISPVHFLQSDLVEKVEEILNKTALSPCNLKLEITENVIIENKELVYDALTKFRSLGIKISIDDFGTGYSSIGYLKDYPADFLKIDRSFVMDTPDDKNNSNICKTIVSLAHNFGIEIIAEGAETKDNVKFLEKIGVEYIQGYYFSKPKSASEWDKFFNSYRVKVLESV